MDEKWNKVGGYTAFPDQEIESDSPWNYALKLTDRKPVEGTRIERHAMRDGFSFSHECVPLSVFIPARRVPSWIMESNSAGELPVSPLAPVALGVEEELIELIPYGFARLRISQFPWYSTF
jgi:hypothetical protein